MSEAGAGSGGVPDDSQPVTNVISAGGQLLQISGGSVGAGGEQQPLVLSAEDAATLLAQAGIQLNDNEQVIIGDIGQGAEGGAAGAGTSVEQATLDQQQLQAIVDQQHQQQQQQQQVVGETNALGEINDGTILYIDPNDPQAAEILQQAGLRLAEDGTVRSVHAGAEFVNADGTPVSGDLLDAATGMQIVQQESDDATAAATAAAAGQMTEAGGEVIQQQQQHQQQMVVTSQAGDSKQLVLPIDMKQEVTNGHILEQALASTIGKQEPVDQTSLAEQEQQAQLQAQLQQQQLQEEQEQAALQQQAQLEAEQQQQQQQQLLLQQQQQQQQEQQRKQQQLQAKPAPVPRQPAVQSPAPAAAPAPLPPIISPSRQIQVGPNQQKVDYTVTGEDGKTQQYVMLCPKDMDQEVLIQTLVNQIKSDPSTKKGEHKTIQIHRPGNHPTPGTRATPKATKAKAARTPVARQQQQHQPVQQQPRQQPQPAAQPQQPQPVRQIQQQPQQQVQQQQQQQQQLPIPAPKNVKNDLFPSQPITNATGTTVVNPNEVFESVVPDLALEPADGSTRVYVKCNYCTNFRSSLNGDTWETILNHILPVAKEEIQTGFYGDLGKHFIRSLRIQVNGKQIVRSAEGKEIPQCEVILTHSLVCRKTKREFIVSNPDANFVANLAKHIRMTQPGNSGRGNSLLCIFCNSPFTYEDYLRHIQPHLDAILATLNCFAGAYCANFYESSIRASRNCLICQEPEPTDLRFLPCTKFSTDYACAKKQQFAVDCFKEHYSDNGCLRLSTSTVTKCSVCKSTQQVYCAVFHITTIIGDEHDRQDVDTQLSVCVNCQKQFINIVEKEQGFDDRLKLFQLKNMEQLCSVLRVILNQATPLTMQKKTLIYTVHENTSNPNSAVHFVKSAEVTQVNPITRLLALAESEVVGSPVKASFVCDLCMFTVDLTSLIATEKEKQKNEMLLAIVLEHLVPHTESLINVIASATGNQMLSLKYDIVAKQSELGPNKKIVLSLTKKIRAANSRMEVIMDKDEEKTLHDVRQAIKTVRTPGGRTSGASNPPENTTAAQLIEANRFIDKHRGKLAIIYQTGCNTTLLNAYTECRLCSKFSFPDFRLAGSAGPSVAGAPGSRSVELCENCVDTVLSLCLPTEPECLPEAEECLALGEAKLVGHRLVLSNNLKKWLSLDGVNLIKKTIDDFDDVKLVDCSNLFLLALKKHMSAVLKTCHKDEDILHAQTGFQITDNFLNLDKKEETAAVMASLEQQIGIPIVQKEAPPSRTEVQVTILQRRSPAARAAAAAAAARNGTAAGKGVQGRKPNGTVINLGAGGAYNRNKVLAAAQASSSPRAVVRVGMQKQLQPRPVANTPPQSTASSAKPATPTTTKTIVGAGAAAAAAAAAAASAAESNSGNEESISAIQNFLDQTSASLTGEGEPVDVSPDVKVPAGIKITSAGKGVVNIRAIADTPRTVYAQKLGAGSPKKSPAPTVPVSSPPAPTSGNGTAAVAATTTTTAAATSSSVRGMKGVSMVTLTANGVVRKVTPAKESMVNASDDEGDSDDLVDDHDESGSGVRSTAGKSKKRKAAVDDDKEDYKPPSYVKKAKLNTPTSSAPQSPTKVPVPTTLAATAPVVMTSNPAPATISTTTPTASTVVAAAVTTATTIEEALEAMEADTPPSPVKTTTLPPVTAAAAAALPTSVTPVVIPVLTSKTVSSSSEITASTTSLVTAVAATPKLSTPSAATSSASDLDESKDDSATPTRSRRQRKEKKIFDL